MNPLEATYRAESRRVLATLVRLLGSFDAAEEALHEAFFAAAQSWPIEGVPQNPYSWLVSTGRNKTIDRWRRQTLLEGKLATLPSEPLPEPTLPQQIHDDELRLIFTCCHPALAPDARIALTLREVGGLTTEEIARAYLVPAPTIAQRIVRAKAKIRDAAIPYEVPARTQLPERIESALHVVYLIFNEGYSVTRDELCADAIRLGRLMVDLLGDPEALGLLALMLLHQARRSTRVDAAGELVLLGQQDRTRWDRVQIAQAQGLIERAMAARRVGPYLLQAAIAALHAEAPSEEQTDWPQIVALYDVLVRVDPSPVIALNRAAALGMRDGPVAGLVAVEAVLPELESYSFAHAARAELQCRVGRFEEARASYTRALELTVQPAEVRLLKKRLAEVDLRASHSTTG